MAIQRLSKSAGLCLAFVFLAACSGGSGGAGGIAIGTVQGTIEIQSGAASPQVALVSVQGVTITTTKWQTKRLVASGANWPFSISDVAPGHYGLLLINATYSVMSAVWNDASGMPIVFEVPADKGIDVGTIVVHADGSATR